MRAPIERNIQVITSPYGRRKGFLRKHNGIDLRSWDDAFRERLPIILCEDAKCEGVDFEKKWGYTYFFSLDRDNNIYLQYTHIKNNPLIKPGQYYDEGTFLGTSAATKYMLDKKYGEHLHFGYHKGWKNRVDPLDYLKENNIAWRMK